MGLETLDRLINELVALEGIAWGKYFATERQISSYKRMNKKIGKEQENSETMSNLEASKRAYKDMAQEIGQRLKTIDKEKDFRKREYQERRL